MWHKEHGHLKSNWDSNSSIFGIFKLVGANSSLTEIRINLVQKVGYGEPKLKNPCPALNDACLASS